MFRSIRTRLSAAQTADSGFSMVEVLIAFVILAIIATASLRFAVQANTSSSYQQHNQVAVTLASQAMESAAATPIRLTVSGVPTIVGGRSKNLVQQSWTTNQTVPGVWGTTYPAWDTAVGVTDTSTQTIPITQPTGSTTFNGTEYSVTTLIGTCFRPKDIATYGSNCTRQSTLRGLLPALLSALFPTTEDNLAAAPTPTPSSLVQMTRVIVVVRWIADDECPSGCLYQTSTLLNTGDDLTWKM